MKHYQPNNISNVYTVSTSEYTPDTDSLYSTLKFSSGSGTIVVTVPSSSSMPASANAFIDCVQWSAAQVQFVTASNFITLKSSSGFKTRTTGSACTLLNLGVDQWLLSGDTTV